MGLFMVLNIKLISTDIVSVLHVKPLFRNLEGISSRKYNKSLPYLSSYLIYVGR